MSRGGNGKMHQEIGQEEIGMDGLAEMGGWRDCTGSTFAGGEWVSVNGVRERVSAE